MGFRVTSDEGKNVSGMIITNKGSRLLGIQLNWMTEIMQVKECKFLGMSKGLVVTKSGIIGIKLNPLKVVF